MIRIALAQVDCTLGDLEENLRRTAAATDRARADGADLVVFPELNLTGYSLGPGGGGRRAGEPRRRSGGHPRRTTGGRASSSATAEAGRHLHTYNTAAYLQEGVARPPAPQALPHHLRDLRGAQALQAPARRCARSTRRFGPVAIAHLQRRVAAGCLPCLAVQDGARVLIVPANQLPGCGSPSVAGLARGSG